MGLEKQDFTCPFCKKTIHSTRVNFRNHIGTHYNPTAAHCHLWYKGYFDRTVGGSTSFCKICGNEFTHHRHLGHESGFQYEAHLINEHGVKKGTFPKLNAAGLIIFND